MHYTTRVTSQGKYTSGVNVLCMSIIDVIGFDAVQFIRFIHPRKSEGHSDLRSLFSDDSADLIDM